MNTRRTIQISLLALGGSLSACGSSASPIVSSGSASASQTPTPAAAKASVSITKSGFGQHTADGYSTVAAAAVITNDSSSDAAAGITVSFSAYDAANAVLGTGSTNLALLRAGQTLAAATDVSVAGAAKVDHIVAQASARSFEKDPHPDAIVTSRNSAFVAGSYGDAKVNGELVSAYVADLKQLLTVAVCYDAAKSIVGGGFHYVDLLPSKGTTGASISVTVTGVPASCEIYAAPSFLS